MKKSVFFLAGSAMIFTSVHAKVGDIFADGGLTYTVSSESPAEVKVTGSDASLSGDILIPATVTHESTEYTVTAFVNSAFSYNNNITSVTVPETVTSISNDVFLNCGSLNAINVSADNSALCSVDGVLYTKDMLNLKCVPGGKSGSFEIPGTVTTIDQYGMYSCANLTEIIIPESVSIINPYAFAQCYNLKSLTIPASVTSISQGFLLLTTSLEEINVADGNTMYCSEDGVLYDASKTALYAYPAHKQGEVVIPESVTCIMSGAFSGCAVLKEFTLPSRIKTINNAGVTFCACPNLTDIFVEEGSEYYSSVDGVLFNKNQGQLLSYPGGREDEYVIPDGTTSLSGSCFRGAKLPSVVIPAAITLIPANCFQNCKNLMRIINQSPTPQSITVTTSFYSTPSDLTVYVPKGSKAEYEAAWPLFSDFREVDIFSVTLDSADVKMNVGESLELKDEIIEMQNVTLKSKVWISSNDATASVDQSGKVTALAEGTATITLTATDEDDNVRTAECLVTISPTSGIEEVITGDKGSIDYSKPFDLYDLNGKHFNVDGKSLPAGVYIVKQGDRSEKIAVK
ncbi:MAG: leucine-rich repeat protein [Barnesiella sp.]|nr:leucine-rich repeat protein [Barnesiella sp.]